MADEMDYLSDSFFVHLPAGSSIDNVVAVDMDKYIIVWNKAAQSEYGIKKADAIGRLITDVVPGMKDDSESISALDLALSGIKSFVPVNKQFKHRQDIESHYIPATDKNNKQLGVMKVIHDVSYRISAENKLEALNTELQLKNIQLERAVNEMITFAVIAGESVRSPIRNIYKDVEHLISVEAGKLSNSGKATFRRIQQALNKMSLLLDDMQQLAMINAPRDLSCITLDEIVEGVKEQMKERLEEANVEIILEKLCVVPGDKALLEKLFCALIDNAVKFNDSGRPVIHIGCEEIRPSGKKAGEKGHMYKITVKDNGIGIGQNDPEEIFELFKKGTHSKKYRGTGVGLTMARKIMHAHNGYIEVEPLEKGTAFNSYFPYAYDCVV